LVIVEDFREAFDIYARIHDGEGLAQGGERTHQDVDLDVASCLEIRDGLAAIAGAGGNPGLGSAASFTFCPDECPQLSG
jgi:hypothetical protein